MKLATALFASAAVVLGIAACASPGEGENEELGSTSQALCMKGQICTPPKNNWWGGTSSSGLTTLDPGTSTSSSGSSSGGTTATCGTDTFVCAGPVPNCSGAIYKTTSTTGEPCDLKVRCQLINGIEQCDCVPGCGGGSFSFGGWNPCMAGKTYTCIGTYCRCT